MPLPRVNNFGLLRYIMALSIMAGHFNFLTGADVPQLLSAYDCVGAFFALSGFLVYNSYRHSTSLKDYLRRRARRLLPPYLLVVAVCAVGLSALSTLPAADYFSSAGFWRYVGANAVFLNFLQPDLPGVFADAPMSAVNASLWTLKEEWMLYLLFPALLWAVRRWRLGMGWTLAAVYLLSVAYRGGMVWWSEQTGNGMYLVLSRQVFGCISFFFTGVALHVWFEPFMRRSWLWFGVALVLFAVSYTGVWMQILLRPAAVGIILIFLGVTGRWGHWAAGRNNISYDIYLFHFPIIQTLAALGVTAALPAGASFVVAVAVTAALGALSWRFLDRRFLRS